MSLKRYFKLVIYFTSIFSIIGIIILSFLSYKKLLPSFYDISKKLIYSKYTRILIDQHNSIQNFIQFNEILLLKKFKNKLKYEVNFAYQIAYSVFERNINNSSYKEVKNEIKEILRNVRFNNGRGYFFIFDIYGKRILYPLNPKKEGKNILNLTDASGMHFIKNIIKMVLLKREGFYEYIRPHPFKKDKFYKKISYVKLFEPFNWIIGAGDYYIDFIKETRNDLLQKLKLFPISNYLGFIIFQNNKPILSKNFFYIKNIPIKNTGLIKSNNYIFNISHLPELKWTLVSILKKNKILEEINKINKEMSYILKIIIFFIIIGVTVILGVLFLVFNKLQKSITFEFSRFRNFFTKIPEDFRKINIERLKFKEFKDLAEYANKMSELLENSFKQLEKEKNNLEVITENSGVGIAIITKNKKIDFCNSEFRKLINFNKNIDTEFYNLFKIKNCNGNCIKDSEDCAVANVFLSKKPFVSENNTIITHDNRAIPVFLLINPIIENFTVNRVVLILRDITEERKIKNELIKLKRAIEQAPVSIVITDINGTIEYVNPFFCKITGYSYEEAVGNNPRVLKTKYNEKLHKKLWETILSGKIWEGEFLNRKKDGKTYWEKAIIGPVFNEKGEITHFIAVKQDITELKNLQKKLIKAKQQAEIANKMKSEFLANMSHEIRTPMNAILGFIDLLYETQLSNQQKRYLDIIKASSENLLKILNDILDLSKLEAGKLEFEEVEFDLRELIKNCVNIFSKKAGEKGLSLNYSINSDVPNYLKGDPTRISQIINNLLSNAIKFTEEGEVKIEVKLNSIVENTAEILFIISDTGVGIPKDKIEIIFQPFSQADSSITRQFGGTGLGLAIISKIVKVYNGKIWVESELRKGSKFYFTLKLNIAEIPKLKRESFSIKGINFKGAKILVAEDNPTNQILIKELLKRYNIDVDIAENGLKALKKLAEKEYNLIFLDWHMPELDGIETVKILRKIEKNESIENLNISKNIIDKLKNRKFNIIALTAAVMSNEKKILQQAGFDEFLSKPIIKEELIKILKKFLPYSESINNDEEKEDLTELKKFIENNDELMKILIETFKVTLNNGIKKMEKALEKKDFKEIIFIAHSIKGSAYNIKLNKIGEIAENIEKEAKEENLEKILILIDKLAKIKIE